MNISSTNAAMSIIGAQKPQAAGGMFSTTPTQSATVQEFQDYAKLTPAQKMRASILKSMGLKEEDLAGMDPAKRQQVEDKIKQMIKARVEENADKKGQLVDVKA